MLVICDKCNRTYDDATRWTICPHGPLGQPSSDYCPKHDLAPCPICDPTKTNPHYHPAKITDSELNTILSFIRRNMQAGQSVTYVANEQLARLVHDYRTALDIIKKLSSDSAAVEAIENRDTKTRSQP